MQRDRFGDLLADGLHRVQGVHGALENHGGLGPANRPYATPRHRVDVVAVEQHASANFRGLGQ